MKKLLSILLAILCVMNLTVVSFAAEEVSYFDEETGTLILESQEQFEQMFNDEELIIWYGNEIPKWFVENHKNIRKVYVGKDFLAGEGENYELFYVFAYCPNIEEVIIDEEHPYYSVYDKAVYTKDKKMMLYYPIQNDDVDIVLHENTEYIYWMCLLDTYEMFLFSSGYYPATDKEYNLYITRQGQLQEMIDYAVGWDMNAESLYYARYANIYVNETQETLDSLVTSEETDYPYTIDTLYNSAIVSAYTVYFSLREYLDEDLFPEEYDKYVATFEKAQDSIVYPEEETFENLCEFYEQLYALTLEGCQRIEIKDFSREEFDYVLANDEYSSYETYVEMFNDEDKAYEFSKEVLNKSMEHAHYLTDRGNPMKPLSTLTSGTCGEGAEWAIDRENGVLSITGNGAISDNYSGFDVFKGIVTTVEIGNGITAIGENVFTGFTAITETKFDGTQSQWDAVAMAEGNDDLLKNVTVNPDPPVEPEQPKEEPTSWDKVVAFFEKVGDFFVSIYEWFVNLFKF